MVKPSTIYYNTSESLRSLPGKDERAISLKHRSKLDSSSSEDRPTPTTPSAPVPAVKSKPVTQRSFSVVSAPPDPALLNVGESARLAALEDRIKVRIQCVHLIDIIAFWHILES